MMQVIQELEEKLYTVIIPMQVVAIVIMGLPGQAMSNWAIVSHAILLVIRGIVI